MWWFEVDSHIRRKLAKWEYERAREMDLLEPGYLLCLHRTYTAEILRYAEQPMLCARLFKGE